MGWRAEALKATVGVVQLLRATMGLSSVLGLL